MKKSLLHSFWLLAFLLLAESPVRGQFLTPVRTEVAGFHDWIDENIAGTTYLQLLVAGSNTVSPVLDLSTYSTVTLDFLARTFNGTNPVENEITVSLSDDNGQTWTVLGTRTPQSTTLIAVETFDLSAYKSTQARLRFSVAGTSNSIGAGIDDISIRGQSGQQYTLTLSRDGTQYNDDGYPVLAFSGTSVVLPDLADCGTWKFAGWDANPTVQSQPAYAGGSNYTTTAANVTLYAIYSMTDRSGESWNEISSLTDIVAGTYVVTNGDFYLPNATVVNGPVQRTLASASLAVNNGLLSGIVPDDMRWIFTGTSSDMVITSYSNGNYLYAINNSDGINVGTIADSWVFEVHESGFAMKNVAHNRYCAVYTAGTDWRSYTTKNASNYKTNSGILELYSLSGTSTVSYSSSPGCSAPSVTEPAAHVASISAVTGSPAFSTIVVNWTDTPGASSYLIKASTLGFNDIQAPLDGVVEPTGLLVKNIPAGVQTVSFTGLSASTTCFFKIYPYNGTSTTVNYKTDGSVPGASASTTAITWLEDFESGSKISFTEADVNLSMGSWKLKDALLGSDSNDKKTGAKSVRMRTSGVLTMNFDKTNGAGVITVYHANYGTLTGGSWKLQISTNGGVDWTDAGPVVECSNVLSPAHFVVNHNGSLRCKVLQLSGDRINIDDVAITDFVESPVSTTWTGAFSNEWTQAANWSNGIPGNTTNVTISVGWFYPELSTPVVISGMIIEPAAHLFIKNNGSMTVNGDFRLKSSAAGTATLLNDGILTVTGMSKAEQYLTTKTGESAKDNWWYISSPVTGASSNSILVDGSANKLGFYSEQQGDYPQITSSGHLLESGKGYLAEINTTGTYEFSGTFNNGTIGPLTLRRTVSAGNNRGFNLIGNPYPSGINWNAITGFGTAQQRTDIKPTIWIRTRNSSGAMVFDTFDGEDGTSLGVRGRLNQFIPPMQSFWVRVEADGTSPVITFTNEMRVYSDQQLETNRLKVNAGLSTKDDSYTSDYESVNKVSQLSSAGVISRNVVKLELTSGQQRDEAIISTNTAASDAYDFYDSEKMKSGHSEIYSFVDGQELVINKMRSIEAGKSVLLGFRPVQSGTFTIRATELINTEQLAVVLVDQNQLTETVLNMDKAYTFTSDGTTTTDRFRIIFRAAETVSAIEDTYEVPYQVDITPDNRIRVRSQLLQLGSTIRLYNLTGQQLMTESLTESNTLIDHQLISGVYIVKIDDYLFKVVVP